MSSSLFLRLLSVCVLILTCTSCYHMPTEDDYSLIPSTNNPDFTGKKNQSGMPNIPY